MENARRISRSYEVVTLLLALRYAIRFGELRTATKAKNGTHYRAVLKNKLGTTMSKVVELTV
jgi:hypothetical protein